MKRGKLFAYLSVSFVAGMLLLYLTWQMAFMHGMIIRGIESSSFQKDFQSAMEAKIPFDWGPYRLIPYSHSREVLVTKPVKRIKKVAIEPGETVAK